jgi:hypothetical protein
VAEGWGYKSVVASNERSSNEGTVSYLGEEINHQYSKSYEFESDFRKYAKRYLSETNNYFSLLRPLYEIQISQIFAEYPKYFQSFKSCNVGSKDDSWCKSCGKCLFVYAAIYPFVAYEQMVDIFGEDLYQNSKLYSLFEELVGIRKQKPFECVGTREESMVAFYLGIKKVKKEGKKLPALLRLINDKAMIGHENMEERSLKILNSFGKQNYLTEKLEGILKEKKA